MEVSRMKMVNEVARALGASILTVLLIAAMTATITTASDYYKVYEYSTAVFKLEWDKDNRMFTISRSSYSGSFQFYSWDFTDKHREIENNKPYYNRTVLRHVWIEYWGYIYGWGCDILWVDEVKEKVDWPVNLVFHGPKVSKSFVYNFFKDIFGRDVPVWSFLSELFSDMYMYLKNYNTSWEWDSDGGAKDNHRNVAYLIGWTYNCKNADGLYVFLHVRFYAPSQPSGEFFSDGDSRYVIATAHFDRDETLFGGRGSGWSECAEKFLVDYIGANAGSKGYTVEIFKDYNYGYNWIDYDGWRAIGLHAVTIRKSVDDSCKYIEYTKGIEDNGLYHVYLNNGFITFIYVDR
jgi:hypothetical protein